MYVCVCTRTQQVHKKNLSIPLRQRREFEVQRSFTIERLSVLAGRRIPDTLEVPLQGNPRLPLPPTKNVRVSGLEGPRRSPARRRGRSRSISDYFNNSVPNGKYATANTRQNDTSLPCAVPWSTLPPRRGFHRAIPPPTRKGENTLRQGCSANTAFHPPPRVSATGK